MKTLSRNATPLTTMLLLPAALSGQIKLSTYLRNYKIGQIVDIKGNGAVHKGMPHKFYHGKTGIIWNVTPRAIGVEVSSSPSPSCFFLSAGCTGQQYKKKAEGIGLAGRSS